MRTLDLREYETSEPVSLSVADREALLSTPLNPTSTVTPFILADFGRGRVAACV